MKKILSAALSLGLLAGALVACGGGTTTAAPTTVAPTTAAPTTTAAPSTQAAETSKASAAPAANGAFKVVLITDIGGVNDESFNQSAWQGLQKFQTDEKSDVSFTESHKDADYIPNLERAADEKVGLIWGLGFLMQDAVKEAADAYPEQAFALVDGSWDDGAVPNAIGVMFRAEESSFQVGYIAGLMTKTDRVGFVLGMESPVMARFKYGYFSGVQTAAKELGKEITIDSVTVESFIDTGKGKATATKMFSDGCDIVFHAAGQVGMGVIEAAKDAGKFAIGVDLDQSKLAPDNVISSALKNVGSAVYDISKRVKAGEKLGGTTVFYGLKEGAVGIPESSKKLVPAEVLDKTKLITEKIIAGGIKVPITEDEFKSYVGSLKG